MLRKLLFSVSAIILIVASMQLSAQERAEKIDEFIQKLVDYNSFSGSVLVADEREILFKGGYSFANREWDIPNTPDTKFRIGSITKQFTAAIILKLREEGKLNLDDQITDHIDYYRKDTGDKITIHNLLVHNSGIPSYTSISNFFHEISIQEIAVDEFVKEYCMRDLEFEPGSQFAYNNSGYYLLGVIIEKATGMSYDEALHKYILDPLEMNDSGFDHFTEILPKRATGYSKLFIDYTNSPYLNMELPYAAGALYSTVEDLYKWDQALYGTNLLSQESLDLFFKPHVDAMGGHYGYGWFVEETDVDADSTMEKLIRHGGGINGFNTLIARIPDKGQLLVLLNNTGGAPLGFMADQIFKILNGQEFEYPRKGISLALYQKYDDEGIETAIEFYKKLKESDQLGLFFKDRSELNMLGYYLMNTVGDLDAAEKILKLNMEEYPDWFNAYDSYAEVKMRKGEDEEAIKYYKKSLEINPGNDNAVEMLEKLGVDNPGKEVVIPNELLESYTGTYQIAPNFNLTIRTENGNLFARATGQPEFQIYPSSQEKFYFKVVDAQIQFNKNENGDVDSLILFQNGREVPGNKVE